ncbi:MAG: heavy-metal-associated domain-containing protein [Bdellovibrionales bacterium]|nr:heavy-metal-associated domain-containing protein [Bdellovibrionales bacterium]
MNSLLLLLITQFTFAGQIHVGVNGMVCAFCANGVEKTFKKETAVENVHVDLDKKVVSITTKDKQDISDERLKELITKSGYSVTTIHREK